VKTAMTAVAADVNRSIASLIETILIDHLASLGYHETDAIDPDSSVDDLSSSQDGGYVFKAARGVGK